MDDFLRVYELLSLVALCNEMHGFYINANKKNYQSLINTCLKKGSDRHLMGCIFAAEKFK